jgi:hypothetical protein
MYLYPGACGATRLADTGTIYYRNPKVEFTNTDTGNSTFSSTSNISIWYDLSGNSNHGTLTNGPTSSVSNSGNIFLDGVDDEIIVANSSSINVSDNITVCMWIKINSSNLGSIKVLISKYQSVGWEFVMGTDGKVGFHGRNGDGTYYYAYNTGNLANDTWCFLVGQKAGLSWNMWLNNTQVQNVTATSIGSISYNVNLRIGSEAGSYFPKANVALVQIYNRALTTAEITQNYEATRTRFGL